MDEASNIVLFILLKMILLDIVRGAGVWILRGMKWGGGPMGFEGWGSRCFRGREVSVLKLELELDLETSEIGPQRGQ